jgi:SagB-type dehydrogenase family enzyme
LSANEIERDILDQKMRINFINTGLIDYMTHLQFAPGFSVQEDADGHLHIHSPKSSLRLKGLSAAIKQGIARLVTGEKEEVLASLVLQEGEELSLFFYYLEFFKEKGLLSLTATVQEHPFITLTPTTSSFNIKERDDLNTLHFQLSRFCLSRLIGQELVLETPLSSIQVILRTERASAFIHRLAKPQSLSELSLHFPEISAEEMHHILLYLLRSQVVVSEDEEKKNIPLRQWEFHDLLFHTRSRLGRHGNPYGGLYPFREEIAPLPAVKAPASLEKVSLDPPDVQNSPPFFDVLDKRQSRRVHGKTPLTKKQLSTFLFHTARIKRIETTANGETARKSYASGGGFYELELYPLIETCEGISPGLYHYHAQEHALYKLADKSEQTDQFLRDAMHSSVKKEFPQVLFLITSRFQRIAWKYRSMAYATTLKNLGSLYQTMYLVATAMDLAPCGIGGGNSDHFSTVTGLNYYEETTVGEFMLGSLV